MNACVEVPEDGTTRCFDHDAESSTYSVDTASSAFAGRPRRGVEPYGFRTAMPDPHLSLDTGRMNV
ncbi:hypothetical protein [Streptomyces sp. AF1A]|uniref:hypothetical protein n=1 Tax=Streptomyces sp. AF1A TaxID=3394350 RepID=UPI0039BCE371